MLTRSSLRSLAERADCGSQLGLVGVTPIDFIIGEEIAAAHPEIDVRVVDTGRDPARTPVVEVMTVGVIVADPDDDYQSAIRQMDEANIRHLLVVRDGRMLSMVSIRDLIRVDIHDKSEEQRYLREYLYQVPPDIAVRHAAA